jgi:hypothetical protein
MLVYDEKGYAYPQLFHHQAFCNIHRKQCDRNRSRSLLFCLGLACHKLHISLVFRLPFPAKLIMLPKSNMRFLAIVEMMKA